MGQFLDKYAHPKWNQGDINHINRSITHNEIEAAIQNLQKRKVQDLMDSLLNPTTPLKKNWYQHSLKFFTN
jgi:hypothetical protein